MKFVLATHNPGKLQEMSSILSSLGVEVISPGDLGIDIEVEETGSTFAENAMLKAEAICEAAKLPAIADDSGLCVDALNGGPGAYWMIGDGRRCCWKICGGRPPGRLTSPVPSPVCFQTGIR